MGIQIIKLLVANTRNSLRNRAAEQPSWRRQRNQQATPTASTAAGSSSATKPDVGPIMLVCYTNHAVDSLMEGVLDAGVATGRGEMVRVGGSSKSERLEPLNLKNVSDRNARHTAQLVPRAASRAGRGTFCLFSSFLSKLPGRHNAQHSSALTSRCCSRFKLCCPLSAPVFVQLGERAGGRVISDCKKAEEEAEGRIKAKLQQLRRAKQNR